MEAGIECIARIGDRKYIYIRWRGVAFPYLLDLLEYIRNGDMFNKGVDIVLISNGLSMNETYLRAFREYGVHLSMSLPGIDTFAKHTGVDNAVGVLHWFGEAKKIGVNTTVNVTVTKLNYHELFNTLAMGLLAMPILYC